MGSGVTKVLSQSKVDEICGIVNSNHEIIRLDVAMYVAMTMKKLQGMELSKCEDMING